jgi:multimeric flavodoxin WrbA
MRMTRGVLLYGSPKKNGNTTTLGKHFAIGLHEGGIHDIQEFWLNELTITPCQGCFACHASMRCRIQDDMQAIYPAVEATDLLIFAIPIYWWHMAAQVKVCLDRFTALLSQDDKLPALTGKDVVVIVSYNYQACAGGVIRMFEEFKEWIGIRLQVIEYCAQSGPVRDNVPTLKHVYELGKATAQRLRERESKAPA